MEIVFNHSKSEMEKIKKAHLESMAAENAVGSLLERYLDSVLRTSGWAWCCGNFVRAIDFIKFENGVWYELQIKNRSNTENSSTGWNTFLKEKCGIDIALTSSGNIAYDLLAKDDTGAITGSDANITLDSGAVIGNGVAKNKNSVVPEYGNYYEAMTDAPQSIDTGSNGWMIKATSGDDTIISGGEDSINAGAGNNFITLKGSAVTIDAASGNNSIFIDDNVKSVILLNYDSSKDTLSGNTGVVTFDKTNTAQENNADTANNETSGDLPGNPNVAPNASDIILDGNDNYFNTVGGSLFTGNDVIKVDLTKAIDPSNPVPVGGFIVSGSETNASFVSTNADAKKGQLVGQVASVYPELMTFTFRGLTLNVKDRQFIDGNNTTVLKTFSSFDDVGTDSDNADDTGNEYEKYVVASIYKWWMKESLNLSYLNYGYSFEDEDATPLIINMHFNKTKGGSNALASVSHSYSYSDGKATVLDLNINKDYYNNLTNYNDVDGGDGGDENTSIYLDNSL